MWRRTLVLGALALSVFQAPAGATVREDPVAVKLTGTVPVAQQGRALRATFELRSASTVEVSNLAIEGDGWAGRTLTARTPRFALTPSGPSRLEIEATPLRPDSRLVLRYDVNGRTYRSAYDFSPAADRRRRGGGGVRRLPSLPVIPRTNSPNAQPIPGPKGLELDGAFGSSVPRIEDQPLLPHAADSRLVHVTGTFIYRRGGAYLPPASMVWLGADGLTVQVFDLDFAGTGQNVKLGEGVTDAFGHFDVTCYWDGLMESDPDLLVLFTASNSKFFVTRENDVVPYFWGAGPYTNFTGTHLDLGGLTVGNEADHGALHILTDLMRDWRWLYTHHSVDLPLLTVLWPCVTNVISHYNPSERSISITEGATWNEHTHAHEYGHHLVHEHFVYSSPVYCNLYCWDTPPDCNHQEWCEENAPTAWGEGLPSYVAHLQASSYGTDYGVAAAVTGSYEFLSPCFECGLEHLADPLLDEAHATALLLDITDSEQDEDFRGRPNGVDALALGEDPVWNTLTTFGPVTLELFMVEFRSLYPQYSEQLWQTEANCGIDYDVTPPGAPVNLHSISHAAGVASGDATPTFQWTRPSDDFSGVAGYSVRIAHNDSMPDAIQDLGNVTTWTSANLAPGHYWVSLRAVDRSGNWSTTHSSWGEIVIRDALPANLVNYDYPGWDHAVVPRASDDATFMNVDAPTTMLPGNSAATHWNSSGKNVGEASTGSNWVMRALLDGAEAGLFLCGATAPGGVALVTNKGPVTVRGGRHTFGARVDGNEEISETDETDNGYAHQWIWTPYVLASGNGVTRAAPPERTGGWEDLPTQAGAWFNCDGIRVTNGTGSNWRVLWLRVDDPLVDYDCRLHAFATGAEDGFGTYGAYSRRAGGCLDAVLYNNLTTPTVPLYDVGIVNASGGSADYYAKLVSASNVYDGDSVTISFPAGEMLRLREFDLAIADTGWYTAKVTIVSGTGPVYLAWYDEGLQTVALADGTQLDTATNPLDPARLDLHLTGSGTYGLAIYRDPKDGQAALSVRLEFEKMRPDYEPVQLARWYAPLVPRPVADGTPTVVALPDTLYGDAASTYLNFVVWNASHGDQPSSYVYNHLCVDGLAKWGTSVLTPNPLFATAYNGTTARNVAGGRHTLSLRVDPYQALEEISEDNNGWGEQWTFGPAVLATTLTRASPPDPVGGWDEVTDTPYGLWYNCDGLRVQAWTPSGHSGYWGAYAVMPGDTSDVDVRLHEVAAGTQQGFSTNLVRSTWGAGQSDFCLVNFGLTAFRDMDVGFLRAGDGEQPYTAQVVKSVFRATSPNAVFGPYTLGASYLVHVHEFWLGVGSWDVTLANASGTVDWGLSLHDGSRTYHTKSTALTGGLAQSGGPGMGERFRVTTPTAGYYAAVVWKSGSADLPLVGLYTLEVKPSTLDAPGGVASRTAFAAAWPNPFQSGATVAFELARECEVSLAVYDLHGARVRTLAEGRWAAGRHEVRWDEGAGGRPVPAGIYFVRFMADGVVTSRRVVKIE